PGIAQRTIEAGARVGPGLRPGEDVYVLRRRVSEARRLALFVDLQVCVVEDALDLLNIPTYPFCVELALAHAASGWLAHRGAGSILRQAAERKDEIGAFRRRPRQAYLPRPETSRARRRLCMTRRLTAARARAASACITALSAL